jgi:hypothetical protein
MYTTYQISVLYKYMCGVSQTSDTFPTFIVYRTIALKKLVKSSVVLSPVGQEALWTLEPIPAPAGDRNRVARSPQLSLR